MNAKNVKRKSSAMFCPLANTKLVPILQGRKRQGGIRFGEMERDALLAHGTSFLLQDRLMNCSDRTVVRIMKHSRDFLAREFQQGRC